MISGRVIAWVMVALGHRGRLSRRASRPSMRRDQRSL